MNCCKSIGCSLRIPAKHDFCIPCLEKAANPEDSDDPTSEELSSQNPSQYKDLGDLTEIDIFAVHHLFQINDPSGCIHYASRKLLLSGEHTAGQVSFDDIKEARDTLTRWLHLNVGQKKH